MERARGHVAYLSGRYAAALRHYQAAAKVFRKLGREVDLARTLSAAINSLIYESRQEEAQRSAAEAREYAEKAGNTYHKLVSTLDQSELYLELNLNSEAAELARQAAEEAKRRGKCLRAWQ